MIVSPSAAVFVAIQRTKRDGTPTRRALREMLDNGILSYRVYTAANYLLDDQEGF